jgi:hypothetical protein
VKLDDLITRHRPRPDRAQDPASADALWHLNCHGLILAAANRQLVLEGRPVASLLDEGASLVISKLAAWEVLAAAQRNGVRLSPRRRRLRNGSPRATNPPNPLRGSP